MNETREHSARLTLPQKRQRCALRCLPSVSKEVNSKACVPSRTLILYEEISLDDKADSCCAVAEMVDLFLWFPRSSVALGSRWDEEKHSKKIVRWERSPCDVSWLMMAAEIIVRESSSSLLLWIHDIDREEHGQQERSSNAGRLCIGDIGWLTERVRRDRDRVSFDLHFRSSSTLNTFDSLIFSQMIRSWGRLNQANSGSSGTTKRVVRNPNKLVSVDWKNSMFCSSGVRALLIVKIHSWRTPGPIKCWFQPWIYRWRKRALSSGTRSTARRSILPEFDCNVDVDRRIPWGGNCRRVDEEDRPLNLLSMLYQQQLRVC